MVAFLGIQNASTSVGTFSQAPSDMRADQVLPQGARLRYISCPQAPFIDSAQGEPCRGF
jgi:hypothetical protein